MTKFTQGPYHYDPELSVIIQSETGMMLEQVFCIFCSEEENIANGYLWAASSEMYNSLKKVCEDCLLDKNINCNNCHIHKVLLKAGGNYKC